MSSIKSKVQGKIGGTEALLNQAYSNLGGIGTTLVFANGDFKDVGAEVHAAAEYVKKAKGKLSSASQLLRDKATPTTKAGLAATK